MKQILPLLAATLALALNAGAGVLPAEKLLPDDTLIVLSVPNFTKAREVYKNSTQGRLWNDPAMKAFKDKLVNQFRDTYLTPLEHDLNVHFEDYTDLPQGQFTLALTRNGWGLKDQENKNAGTLLLLDTGSKSSQLKTNLADLRQKWVDAGKPVRTEKIRDVEFSVISVSAKDLPRSLKKKSDSSDSSSNGPPAMPDDADLKKPVKREVYVGQADSLLIMGDSAKTIEKVLAAMAGASVKTLGDVPAFAATQAGLFRDAPAYAWINTKTMVAIAGHADDNVQETDADVNPFSYKMAKILSAVGLDGLKTVAVCPHYTEAGAEFTLACGVPEDERAGLFKILAGESKEYNPPAFVPADAVKFSRWRIDGQQAWATLQKIMADINPQAMNGVNFVLGTAEAAVKDKDPDFDIRKYLFGNLGDDVVCYAKTPKGHSLEELNSAPSLYLIGSPNPEQLATGLKGLLALVAQGATAKEREFLGKKIFSLPMPTPEGAPARSLNYAWSGGYVAIAADPGILEEYLRSSQEQGKSLRDTAGLADATQKVAGTGTSIFGYSNDSETMRTMVEALKADSDSSGLISTLGPMAAAFGLTSPDKIKQWFDPSLLPAFSKIADYFYFTVYGWTTTADGLTFKVFTPTPPRLSQNAPTFAAPPQSP